MKTGKKIISIACNPIFDKEDKTMELIDFVDLQIRYLASLFIFVDPGANTVPGT